MDLNSTPVSSATVSAGWRFAYHSSHLLPPQAWIASIDAGRVDVRCGTSVRCTPDGFAEGAWVGSPEIASLPASTAVFGTGMVADGDTLMVVPPSHPLERVYFHRSDGGLVASNSLVAVLETRGLQLDPNVLYPPIFVAAADGVRNPTMDVPTSSGVITTGVYYNFSIGAKSEIRVEGRPREWPFTSFEDFKGRVTAALRSAVANAPPGYEMAVSLSSGYDSTAVAAIAATVGCRHALSAREGKPVAGTATDSDSGERAAQQLGMTIELFDRLAYLDRDDFPEAEFLATGMSGEDVVVTAMEPAVRRRILLTGAEEFEAQGWATSLGAVSRRPLVVLPYRVQVARRLHPLPLLFFGASEKFSLIDITDSAEMRPWTMPSRTTSRSSAASPRRVAWHAALSPRSSGGAARAFTPTASPRCRRQARRRSRNSQRRRAAPCPLVGGRSSAAITEPSCGRHGLFVPSDSLRHSTFAGERWSTPSLSSALCSSGGASASCGPATPLTHRPSHLATQRRASG